MDQTPIDGGDQLSLEDILAEFAPTDSPAPAPEPPGKEDPVPQPPAAEKPAADESTPEKPLAEKPLAERPATVRLLPKKAPARRPAEETSAEKSPSEEIAPAEEQPVKKKPAREVTPDPAPTEEKPVKEKTGEKATATTAAQEPPTEDEPGKKLPWWKRKAQPTHLSDKVIALPEADMSVTGRIGRLIEKGDRYAETMFAGDEPEDLEQTRREQLLPGVDWESEPTHTLAPRHRRVLRRPKPDTPPGKLAMRYKKGLGFLHTRTVLAFLLFLPQLYLALAPGMGWFLPASLADNTALLCHVAALGLCISTLLCADVLAWGLACLLKLRLESETVLLFAVAAALADALTVPILGEAERGMPFCAVVALCQFFALWGKLLKRRGLWRSCRAAAGAAEPYLVTLDEKMWDGKDSFTKWAGTVEGYGSQVQDTDGVQRTYHIAAPLISIFAGLFALLASVGRREPGLFFWCLSACLTAGCGFTAFLSFAMPFSSLSLRLSKIGAALGGWDGIGWRGRHQGVILTDTDLFPPGSITLNGIKLLGDASMETSLAYTVTLIRETGSGLEKPFSDMLRAKGGLCRRVSHVVFHEGGVTGVISGQNVAVGSGAFMELMGVSVPPGLKVKNAVFCAVDNTLSAIYALNYSLHPAIAQALDVLVENGTDPILATRDFLIIPEMLRQRFKLPVDKMEFPNLDRRRELSSKRIEHERILTAVLCREGLGPYADAVVGRKRLLGAVRWGLVFALLGAGVGLVLSFYLCLARAFTSLTPGTMLAFLLLWLVPASLISGWANRY